MRMSLHGAALPGAGPTGRSPGGFMVPRSALRVPRFRGAFTLIEIMIVVAILAIVLGMGVPPMFRMLRQEGMRAAVSDVLEVCQKARASAILSGTMMQLQILPETREFKVIGGGAAPPAALGDPIFAPAATPASGAASASFAVQLAREIQIELLDVNFVELKNTEDVRVRFYPNGTCDEFSIVIRSPSEEWRKISLEVTTALADLEVIR